MFIINQSTKSYFLWQIKKTLQVFQGSYSTWPTKYSKNHIFSLLYGKLLFTQSLGTLKSLQWGQF